MDLSKFKNNNLDICLIESNIPESAKIKPCCMGIDEAGRGPVLGEPCLVIPFRPIPSNFCVSRLPSIQSSAETRLKLISSLCQTECDFFFCKSKEPTLVLYWKSSILIK